MQGAILDGKEHVDEVNPKVNNETRIARYSYFGKRSTADFSYFEPEGISISESVIPPEDIYTNFAIHRLQSLRKQRITIQSGTVDLISLYSN